VPERRHNARATKFSKLLDDLQREWQARNISYSAMWRAAEFRVSHVPGSLAIPKQLLVRYRLALFSEILDSSRGFGNHCEPRYRGINP
jgi:hypothetical protein